MPVTLALTSDGKWDISTADLVAATADAGFSAVGLQIARAEPAAAAMCADAGLRCHELMALQISEDGATTRAAAERLAEGAEVLGAEWVLTIFLQGLSAETGQVIADCAAIFAEVGTRMAVEFSPLGPISSIRSGLDVVAAAGAGRAGLMIDAWHFTVGDSTWEDLEAVPLEQIAYVQFCDGFVPDGRPRMRDAVDHRAFPGQGTFDLHRFAATLLDRGWEGTVSQEVLSAELRALPVPEFCRQAYAAAAPYWM